MRTKLVLFILLSIASTFTARARAFGGPIVDLVNSVCFSNRLGFTLADLRVNPADVAVLERRLTQAKLSCWRQSRPHAVLPARELLQDYLEVARYLAIKLEGRCQADRARREHPASCVLRLDNQGNIDMIQALMDGPPNQVANLP